MWRWEQYEFEDDCGDIVTGEEGCSTHEVIAQQVDKPHADLILGAIQDQRMLRALQAGGVDNWEGYGEALRSLKMAD